MKHLRKFNEAWENQGENKELVGKVLTPTQIVGILQPKVDRIKDFCETHLAYLLDKGFEINCSATYLDKECFFIKISEPGNSIPNQRRQDLLNDWQDISDQIITFLHFLLKKFDVVQGDVKYNTTIKSPIMFYVDGETINNKFDNMGPITSVYPIQDLIDNEEVLNGSKIGSIILYVKEK
jgi:hypothetical protein